MSQKFFKNSLMLYAVEVALKLRGLILLPWLTKHFGSVNYGVWAQVTVFSTAVLPLIFFGTDSALARFYPASKDGERRNLYSSWVAMVALNLGIALILLSLFPNQIGRILGFSYGEFQSHFLVVTCLLVAGSVFSYLFKSWFRYESRVKGYSKILLAENFLSLLPLLWVLIFNKSVEQLLFWNALGLLALSLVLFFRIVKHEGFGKVSFRNSGPLLRFGAAVLPAGYSYWILNFGDRFFLAKYSTLSSIGVYSLAYSLGMTVQQLFMGPLWTMYPIQSAAHHGKSEFAEMIALFQKTAGLMLAITLPAGLGLYLVGRHFLMAFSTEEFAKGGFIIGVICLAYMGNMLSAFFETLLGLVGRPSLSTVSVLVGAVLNVILNYLWVPRFGIAGAAYATFLGFWLQMVFAFSMERIFANILVVKWKVVAKLLACSSLMYLSVLWLDSLMTGQPLLKLVSLSLLGAAVYGGGLWLCGVLDSGLIEKVFKLLGTRREPA